MEQDARYGRSLERLLHEVKWTLSKRNANNALFAVAPQTNWSFFSYASLALKNDMVSHAIKVLDHSRKSSSFWYIHRSKSKVVETALLNVNLTVSELDNFSKRIRIIRDQTHFHIDKAKVFSPSSVWKEANISGDEFNKIFDGLWSALNELYVQHFGCCFPQTLYDGQDVARIVALVREGGIEV